MSTQTSDNNKRIAKNTVYLYFRMMVTVLVSLYTSRVILKTLGVSDFGVYNVMGGIIGMLGYVNSLLAGGTSRFLTIGLGKNDMPRLKMIFSTSYTLCVTSSVLILLLGETIGLWFVNTQLNIDPLRMEAANWVYQCALFSSALTVVQTVFTASIISHEKMSIYAYMSILDVVFKLGIVFMLLWFDFDKLKLYALLMFVVNTMVFSIYYLYCKLNFEEIRTKLSLNRDLFKEMFSYSSWNMIGGFSGVLNNYGINILLNIFFGTIVNASRGVALQVNNLVQQFYSNFQMASQPQIMKYYAQGKIADMSHLIVNNSKYCSLILLCPIIPIFIYVDKLLFIWLGQVPDYSSSFVRITLIYTFLCSIDAPVGMGIHAVGKMKLPNCTTAIVNFLNFPIVYMVIKLGANPIVSYCFTLTALPINLCIDLLILRRYTGFSITTFIKKTLVPIAYITMVGLLVPMSISFLLPDTILLTIVKCILSAVYIAIVIFFLGLSESMRNKVLIKLKVKHENNS